MATTNYNRNSNNRELHQQLRRQSLEMNSSRSEAFAMNRELHQHLLQQSLANSNNRSDPAMNGF
jgi:hypothetical protein